MHIFRICSKIKLSVARLDFGDIFQKDITWAFQKVCVFVCVCVCVCDWLALGMKKAFK